MAGEGAGQVRTVLHLSSSSGPGGAESVVASNAVGLDASRYRSVVCLFRDGWLRERCQGRGLETHILPITGMLDHAWLRGFRRLLRSRGVCLIHAHEFGANTYGTLAGWLSGVPVVATVHGRSYYPECLRRRLAYRAVSRAATLVAVSEDAKRFLVEKTGASARRVHVVYNGIGMAPPVPADARIRLRHELGIVTSEPVVGVVGNLYEVKGHRYLLEAAPGILRACPRTTFLIAGRGHLEEPLRHQARQLGIDARVLFLGLRPDIPALLSLCDVFVQPSLSEGLSIAILEAMGAGLPVVTTRVGGNPELVVDGETGVLVEPANSQELSDAVTRLLRDPGEARRLGDNGLHRVRSRFTVAAMVEGYQAIYDARLGRASQRTPEGAPTRSRMAGRLAG